ncbi:hypothetical protein B484DRAFT_398298 [Ochromonadaceae sp. CCMP2298]|nr:hypothetical protein B484DRAFT_398298 [Ochromonadaceae sp. CCMP2298]
MQYATATARCRTEQQAEAEEEAEAEAQTTVSEGTTALSDALATTTFAQNLATTAQQLAPSMFTVVGLGAERTSIAPVLQQLYWGSPVCYASRSTSGIEFECISIDGSRTTFLALKGCLLYRDFHEVIKHMAVHFDFDSTQFGCHGAQGLKILGKPRRILTRVSSSVQPHWAAKFLVKWVEGDDVMPVHQVLECLHDAMEAGWNNLSFEKKKMEEVRLWAFKKQARPDTAMMMVLGQGLLTWADPATTTTSSCSNSPVTSIRVDRMGLVAFAKFFIKTDSTLTVKFYDHFIAAILCPHRQERAVGLPKGWNGEKVPHPSPAVAAAQQEKEGRWEGRDLAADRALMAEMRRLSDLRSNMLPEVVEALQKSQRLANMTPEAREAARKSMLVVNMKPEALEKKRARDLQQQQTDSSSEIAALQKQLGQQQQKHEKQLGQMLPILLLLLPQLLRILLALAAANSTKVYCSKDEFDRISAEFDEDDGKLERISEEGEEEDSGAQLKDALMTR